MLICMQLVDVIFFPSYVNVKQKILLVNVLICLGCYHENTRDWGA